MLAWMYKWTDGQSFIQLNSTNGQMDSPLYSKTPLLRPPLGLRKNSRYSGVVLLLS